MAKSKKVRTVPLPSNTPRIVVVAQEIASLQTRRASLDTEITANDLRGEKLQTALDVVDSEQRTYEREMDSLTRSMLVRK